jgi:hypothetical protein
VEPPENGRSLRQHASLARRIDEHVLGNFAGEMGVASRMAQRDRIDEIEMPLDEAAECILRVFLNEFPKKGGVVDHGSSISYLPIDARTTQES